MAKLNKKPNTLPRERVVGLCWSYLCDESPESPQTCTWRRNYASRTRCGLWLRNVTTNNVGLQQIGGQSSARTRWTRWQIC